MTFKHIKFNDSFTMKSLEKVAVEKGLIKPEAMVKEASSKEDFSPSSNLSINIIKLCDGLRSRGLSAYADDLEKNFLNYKKAESLYSVSKETGEDLIDMAHPKGSHKLEGVEGDAVIETVVDRHKKIVEKINKKPTGKLTTAKEIIDAVKHALGQGVPIETGIGELAKDISSGIELETVAPAAQQATQQATQQVSRGVFSTAIRNIIGTVARTVATSSAELAAGGVSGLSGTSMAVVGSAVLAEVLLIAGLGYLIIKWGDSASTINEQADRVIKEINDIINDQNVLPYSRYFNDALSALNDLKSTSINFGNIKTDPEQTLKNWGVYIDKLHVALQELSTTYVVAEKIRSKEFALYRWTFSGLTDVLYAISGFINLGQKTLREVEEEFKKVNEEAVTIAKAKTREKILQEKTPTINKLNALKAEFNNLKNNIPTKYNTNAYKPNFIKYLDDSIKIIDEELQDVSNKNIKDLEGTYKNLYDSLEKLKRTF
jgi:hypothetical protein